ncbi:ATP synthase epsilon chain [Durusdinium trenchii]|uniref:Chloroplastic n=1 Tax=Durusdinium trenchii TaxID=1381693 RepID=A0ABP0S1M4_9DINO
MQNGIGPTFCESPETEAPENRSPKQHAKRCHPFQGAQRKHSPQGLLGGRPLGWGGKRPQTANPKRRHGHRGHRGLRFRTSDCLGSGEAEAPPAAAGTAGTPRGTGEGGLAPVAAARTAKPVAVAPERDTQGVLFRSDAELWPPEMEAKPLLRSQRRKLRRVTREVRKSYQECQEDMKELKGRISGYRRACTGKSELSDALTTLEGEARRLETCWRELVADTISQWSLAPRATSATLHGVRPQVVRGQRWYAACVEGAGRRILGPLRPKAQDAVEDHLKMSSGPPNTAAAAAPPPRAADRSVAEDADPSAGEKKQAPPVRKRLRLARHVDLT